MRSTILLSLTILTLACGTASADVINLVTNGSFEQGTLGIGSFTGWTTNADGVSTYVDSDGLTGNLYGDATNGLWSAFFGQTAALGGAFISENLATTANSVYVLSFDLANSNQGGPAVNSFAVSIAGTPVFTIGDVSDQNYVHEWYSFTASGSVTSLQISASNDNGYFDLDNVAVSPAPEPAAFALMGIGILVLCGQRFFRRAALLRKHI